MVHTKKGSGRNSVIGGDHRVAFKQAALSKPIFLFWAQDRGCDEAGVAAAACRC
jgi:hypothetical protein